MPKPKKNIVWNPGLISSKERTKFLKQKGIVLWFTGLSGSGKSTLANVVEKMLVQKGFFAFTLDGDNIRHGLCNDLGFSENDRKENVRRISHVTKLFCDAQVIVITAFISPYRADRSAARNLIDKNKFLEIYCKASLEVCESRDPKGLYKKARAGEISDFTGISAPYEEPENPELIIETHKADVQTCARQIFKELQTRGIV